MQLIRQFVSTDGTLEVALPRHAFLTMLEEAEKARGLETGGILVGNYSPSGSAAIVTTAEPAPPDSRAGRTWFQRGVQGISELLHRLWERPQATHYLGEWHYHPGASSRASWTDFTTMKRGRVQKAFQCEKPILVILGGDPQGHHTVSVYVFLKGKKHLELQEVQHGT